MIERYTDPYTGQVSFRRRTDDGWEQIDASLVEEDQSSDGGYRLKDTTTLAREQDRTQGILPLEDQKTIDFFNKTYGTNFSSPEEYGKWLYGGGSAVNTAAGQGFQIPNFQLGTQTSQYLQNQPLSYSPQSFVDQGWIAPLALATAGMTGLLPGTTAVGSGAAAGGAGTAAGEFSLASGAPGAGIGGGSAGLGLTVPAETLAGTGAAIAGGTPFSLGTPGLSAGVVGGTGLLPGLEQAAGALAPSGGGGTTSGGTTPDPTGLAKFIKDYGSILGPLLSGGLGILESNAQGNAYQDVANQFMALGAPGRAAFDASFAPGVNPAGIDPALQPAIDTASQAAARASAARYGDPTIPGAQAEQAKYLLGSTILPQVNTARSQFLTRGGMGVNTAGTGSLASAQTAGGPYGSLGYAAGQILNPPTPLEDLMKQLQGYGIRIA